MKNKKTVDAGTIQRLHDIVDSLASPSVVDAEMVRRLHAVAKEITSLADSLGRHERVDFDEVWPESVTDKKIGRKCLPLFLGLTSTGEKLVTDLASLPHLLVGGATGQGKSNLLNSIICGLTRLLPPDELRLVLVDTKMVEFTPYAALPHLAFPIITDDNKCLYVLRWLVAEMERRLKLFARAQCRNIQSYRKGGNALPYIVVIIDEFADLMASHRKDFEPVVARLTAMARAAGIHLVMATQVADHKVLSATLRCNIPGRISFKTRSGWESKLIIDAPDADVLCAPGDMLVRQKDGTLTHAQCAYLSGEEEARIIEAVEKQYGSPKFLASLPDVVFLIQKGLFIKYPSLNQ
jgi:S-DNA-T family DNA segregation ATPase FtsK/SpoIIIE